MKDFLKKLCHTVPLFLEKGQQYVYGLLLCYVQIIGRKNTVIQSRHLFESEARLIWFDCKQQRSTKTCTVGLSAMKVCENQFYVVDTLNVFTTISLINQYTALCTAVYVLNKPVCSGTDLIVQSAVTSSVVKLVYASWIHEMTGVILYFANTDT